MWVIGFFNKQQCVNFVSFCIIVKCVINLHDQKPHKRESNVLGRDKGLSKYSNLIGCQDAKSQETRYLTCLSMLSYI